MMPAGASIAKLLMVGAAFAASSINVAALDVRAAGDEEIAVAIQGCWDQEWTLEQNKYEEEMRNKGIPRIPLHASACFSDDGVLDSGWVGGDEGMEGPGTYEVSDGKLRLHGSGNSDYWIFGTNDLECDLIMSAGRAMKLMNCVGVGSDAGTPVADSSYGFAHAND